MDDEVECTRRCWREVVDDGVWENADASDSKDDMDAGRGWSVVVVERIAGVAEMEMVCAVRVSERWGGDESGTEALGSEEVVEARFWKLSSRTGTGQRTGASAVRSSGQGRTA